MSQPPKLKKKKRSLSPLPEKREEKKRIAHNKGKIQPRSTGLQRLRALQMKRDDPSSKPAPNPLGKESD